MEHRNTSSGSSTKYEIGIEDSEIVVAVSSAEEDSPSFRTSLSAGDRSALALSLFFASLRREDLSEAVVIIDDPVTSLDIRRQRATINEIVAVSMRSAQLIVLSHERDFLIRLWKALGRHEVQPMCLEVGSETPSSSKVMVWDVSDAALTEENRALMRIELYTEQPQRDRSRETARPQDLH
jgi:DNA repair exonuclease SbcCD ATPase subunit